MEKTSTATEFSNPKSIDVTESRIKTSNSVLMGFGGSYKLKEGHLFGEINYQYSFTNINKDIIRLDNDNLIFNYFYIEDDQRL